MSQSRLAPLLSSNPFSRWRWVRLLFILTQCRLNYAHTAIYFSSIRSSCQTVTDSLLLSLLVSLFACRLTSAQYSLSPHCNDAISPLDIHGSMVSLELGTAPVVSRQPTEQQAMRIRGGGAARVSIFLHTLCLSTCLL